MKKLPPPTTALCRALDTNEPTPAREFLEQVVYGRRMTRAQADRVIAQPGFPCTRDARGHRLVNPTEAARFIVAHQQQFLEALKGRRHRHAKP
jgi:hypothetical protein